MVFLVRHNKNETFLYPHYLVLPGQDQFQIQHLQKAWNSQAYLQRARELCSQITAKIILGIGCKNWNKCWEPIYIIFGSDRKRDCLPWLQCHISRWNHMETAWNGFCCKIGRKGNYGTTSCLSQKAHGSCRVKTDSRWCFTLDQWANISQCYNRYLNCTL